MTKLSRANLATQDSTVLLQDNTTSDILPSEHRQSNLNIHDSFLSLVDDNIDKDADTSLKYLSDPSGAWDSSPTHDLKLIPKIYVDDALANYNTQILTNKVIYVDATNGTDTRTGLDKYDLNNPFATIQSAVSAMVTDDIIYVRSGTHNESVTVSTSININMVLDRVTWTGTTTLPTLKATATVNCTLHLIDSIMQNTGDSTVNGSCITGFNSIKITTNEELKANTFIPSNLGIITISTALRTHRNRISSTNSPAINGGMLECSNCYIESSSTFATLNGISLTTLIQNKIVSINKYAISSTARLVMYNNFVFSKETCIPTASNLISYYYGNFFYSSLVGKYCFSGEASSQGGNSTYVFVVAENNTFSSDANPINHSLGNSAFMTRMKFVNNNFTSRSGSFCINSSVWDNAGATVSDYSILIANGNTSNVDLLNLATPTNSNNKFEKNYNIENSLSTAIMPY